MSSRKEELVAQIEDISAQINELRKVSSKNNKDAKEKTRTRLTQLMADLIVELDSLKEPENVKD